MAMATTHNGKQQQQYAVSNNRNTGKNWASLGA